MAKRHDQARDFYTTREAAKVLGVSLTTVQLWVEAGILPAWKTPGGHRRLARDAVDRLQREQQSAKQPALGRLKVLVVEDEPVQRELYRLQFARWGLNLDLRLAENGFDGLIQVGREVPDLVITDLDMPGMDGFQMIRHLFRQVPGIGKVVVVSALSPEEIRARGGVPEQIPVYAKPVPFAALRKLIEQELTERAFPRRAS
ncbi:response regulator [Thioalkalivibrio sulfidiphilus]|uniref:response regulator n=1 Tax=Thioalkalivibrio sulfidiphilus TaxID=1033854 RepID=UPI00036E9B8B|nr:response regulator [Thioalkalivibrio sulfidiphilus]